MLNGKLDPGALDFQVKPKGLRAFKKGRSANNAAARPDDEPRQGSPQLGLEKDDEGQEQIVEVTDTA